MDSPKDKNQVILIDLSNDVSLEMIMIYGGEFEMGSPEQEEDHFYNEYPQHTVKVPSFYMSKFPITQEQWREVVKLEKPDIELKSEPCKPEENIPVENISWVEAVEFCQHLNRLPQSTTKRLIFRLPSEAEWEYACRANTNTRFYFGNTITTEHVNFNSDRTNSVDHFDANSYGVHDMHGNVWEWCQDFWHDNYKNAPTDGSAWIDEENNYRIIRGGSWFSLSSDCRSARRQKYPQGSKNKDIGFRIVSCLPKKENISNQEQIGSTNDSQNVELLKRVYVGRDLHFRDINETINSSKRSKYNCSMKENIIKIFLASSSELKENREQFEIFINRQNKVYIKDGIFLELVLWEDFIDAMSQTRLQDEYKKAITDCDIFVSLFFTKVGKYTEEEFLKAWETFKVKNKPLIYTYFKDANIRTGNIREDDILSLLNFRKKLIDSGHNPTEYTTIDSLKNHFSDQLRKLLPKLLESKKKNN